MKLIALTQGEHAIVDDEDYSLLMRYNWHASRDHKYDRYYALTKVLNSEGKQTSLPMHRLILGANDRRPIDHNNGNGLDNRRSNLRFCSARQNQQNQRRRRVLSSSGFKGVSWSKKAGKWETGIRVNGRRIFLGYFDDLTEAVVAYDRASLRFFDEFARPNMESVKAA